MTILDHLHTQNRNITDACDGHQKCGRCLIRVTNRELPETVLEKKILPEEKRKEGWRLACAHPFEEGDQIEII